MAPSDCAQSPCGSIRLTGPRKPRLRSNFCKPAASATRAAICRLRIEGGADRVAFAVKLVLAIESGQLAAHFLGEGFGGEQPAARRAAR